MDLDVDVVNREQALLGLPHIAAALVNKQGVRQRHPCGVYFQRVPVDVLDQWCAYDYETAADLGYYKIDVLNNTIYRGVRDEEHLVDLLMREPEWELLDAPEIVNELAHIRGHFKTVQQIKPRSIEDLAVVLAIIRPGKRHLLGQPRDKIDAEIWDKDDQGYVFKKAHAIAFATSIVVQLNLMVEQYEAAKDRPEELEIAS